MASYNILLVFFSFFQLPYLLPASFPASRPVWRLACAHAPPQAPVPPSLLGSTRPALRRSWLIPIPSYSRAPRPLHRLNKDGGLPSRPLQGASTGRPRPSGHASPQPSSLLRQAPQGAVLLRGLHGGKEKRETEKREKNRLLFQRSSPFLDLFTGNFLETERLQPEFLSLTLNFCSSLKLN